MATEIPEPLPPREETEVGNEQAQRTVIIVLVVVLIAIVLGILAASYWMLNNPAETEILRDIFIIFMALESLIIGIALIVLIVQLARLTNLLQNEIKPILENTNETVNTVRGTAQFVSENISEPMIKLSSMVAGVQQFLQMIKPVRPRRKE